MSALTVVWILLLMPVGSTDVRDEFEVFGAHFATLADCDAAARKWQPFLADAAYDRHHVLAWEPRHIAPPGATAIYTCKQVERQP